MAALQEKKSCGQRMEEVQRYCWNPDTGQLLGRTLSQWVWISLYYVAFYVVITGLFALCLYSLMCTLDPYTPDYQDQLKSPGVTLRPDVYGEKGLDISYNVSDNRTWTDLVHTLHDFLAGYSPAAQQDNINCTSEKVFIQESFSAPNHTKFSCKFTTDMLHNCSGLEDPSFGFEEGKPCFIIKMNRTLLSALRKPQLPPVPPHSQTSRRGHVDTFPFQIVRFLPSNKTAPRVDCTFLGQDQGQDQDQDQDQRRTDVPSLQVEYYPPNGTFSLHYFPYYGKKAQPHYSNPLVAAKLLNVPRNTEVDIVCKILAEHVTFDNPNDPFEGKVAFKLKIQK